MLDFPALIINADAMVMRVGDHQPAFLISTETAWPTVPVIGSSESDPEMLAVKIVGLNPGCEVDHPEPILAVDGRGPGSCEIAISNTPMSPDQVG